MSTSIFSQIVSGLIPCYKVAEDDNHLAFLDISPLSKGHTLVIPKKETDYLFDLDSIEYKDLWLFAKRVSKAQKSAIECKRIGVAVVGLEVPHAHIHLIPINSISDMDFNQPKLELSSDEMQDIALQILKLF